MFLSFILLFLFAENRELRSGMPLTSRSVTSAVLSGIGIEAVIKLFRIIDLECYRYHSVIVYSEKVLDLYRGLKSKCWGSIILTG